MQTRLFLPFVALATLTGCTIRPPEQTLSNEFPASLQEMNAKVDEMAGPVSEEEHVSIPEKLVLYHCLHLQMQTYQKDLLNAVLQETALMNQPASHTLKIKPAQPLPVSAQELQKRLGLSEEQISRIHRLFHDSLKIVAEETSYMTAQESSAYLSEQERHFADFAHKMIAVHSHMTGKPFNPIYLRDRHQR